MKKYLVSISFLIFIFYSVQTNAIDTIGVKYYPLAPGNVWVYSSYTTPQGYYFRYKLEVTGTSVINNHLYFNIYNYRNNTTRYVRVDSTNGNALNYYVDGCAWLFQERLIDSLSAKLSDSTAELCDRMYICSDSSNISYFSSIRKSKSFYVSFPHGNHSRKYARGLGLIREISSQWVSAETINLLGCVIEGVVYGDTALVGINQISTEVPGQFSLSQNYPNPFNPTTKIKFSIPNAHLSFGEGLGVWLIVYDALGKEVQTLVNENLSAGTYEVEFNGSNLPSGVYYYQLGAGSFSETRKMVLVK